VVHSLAPQNFFAGWPDRFTALRKRLIAAEIRRFSTPRALRQGRLRGLVHPNAMKLLEVIGR
jgi:hypothetical protein